MPDRENISPSNKIGQNNNLNPQKASRQLREEATSILKESRQLREASQKLNNHIKALNNRSRWIEEKAANAVNYSIRLLTGYNSLKE